MAYMYTFFSNVHPYKSPFTDDKRYKSDKLIASFTIVAFHTRAHSVVFCDK